MILMSRVNDYVNVLDEQPKVQSLSTKLWGLMVKIVSGSHPSLYGCQQSLPK